MKGLVSLLGATFVAIIAASAGGAPPFEGKTFTEKHCTSCHDGATKSGWLDLTVLSIRPDDPDNMARWVKLHDRVRAGEVAAAEWL